MSALLATLFSCSASAQADSSGTATSPAQPPAVSTATSVTAPSVSTRTVSASTAAVSAPTPSPAPAPAALPPALVPRPWVIGDIRASGLKNVKFSTIRAQTKARKGDLYDRPDLDKDVQALLGLGEFDRVGAEITLLDKPVPANFRKVAGTDREILLTFVVKEKPVIHKVDIEGNKGLSKGTLMDEITLKVADPYDRFKLEEDRKKVVDKYHEKGYLDATVETAVKLDTETQKVNVTFKIDEAQKSRIELVEISGVKAFKPHKLLGLMKNKYHKVFTEKELAEDVKKIEAEYKNAGYLDVRISTPVVSLSPDKTRIHIALGVIEGRSYLFGDTSFSGYLVLKSSELYHAVDYKPGQRFNEQKYEDTIRAVQELYADAGRLRTRVIPLKTLNPKTDRMDVRYDIIEGPVSYVDHIDVEGNKAAKTYVLRRECSMKSGDRFSAARVKRCRERMMNLGFLDDVEPDLQPSPTDPDKVDMTFDVTEGKPGMLTAGAAYSSIDGIIGTLSLSHMDVFGLAQRVSINWSFGARVNDLTLSWTEPWIGDHPTSLGYDVFDSMMITPFYGDLSAYTMRRVGGDVRLGPRFEDDRYIVNMSYTLQQIGVENIDPTMNFNGLLTPGTSIQSMASVEFARDTRDSIIDPTHGTRNSIGSQLSGGPLFGNVNFIKPTYGNQAHFTLFEAVDDWPFVMSLYNRGGYITPFGGSRTVDVQDRFFIGGQDTLRGYLPAADAGVADGGVAYDVANLEFGFPVAREHYKTIVKLVVFADAGGSWDSVHQINDRFGGNNQDLKSDVGLGIRFVTPAFPIRLDYGYGLNHQPGQKAYQINFGMGPLF